MGTMNSLTWLKNVMFSTTDVEEMVEAAEAAYDLHAEVTLEKREALHQSRVEAGKKGAAARKAKREAEKKAARKAEQDAILQAKAARKAEEDNILKEVTVLNGQLKSLEDYCRLHSIRVECHPDYADLRQKVAKAERKARKIRERREILKKGAEISAAIKQQRADEAEAAKIKAAAEAKAKAEEENLRKALLDGWALDEDGNLHSPVREKDLARFESRAFLGWAYGAITKANKAKAEARKEQREADKEARKASASQMQEKMRAHRKAERKAAKKWNSREIMKNDAHGFFKFLENLLTTKTLKVYTIEMGEQEIKNELYNSTITILKNAWGKYKAGYSSYMSVDPYFTVSAVESFLHANIEDLVDLYNEEFCLEHEGKADYLLGVLHDVEDEVLKGAKWCGYHFISVLTGAEFREIKEAYNQACKHNRNFTRKHGKKMSAKH